MGRLALRLFAGVLFLLVLSFLVLSLDLRPYREPGVGAISAFGMTGPSGAGLLAGAAEVEITPRRPMPLGGFAARRGKDFDSIRDPAFARALVISSATAGPSIALVNLDAVLVPAELAEAIRTEARARVNDLVDLIVTATHTHSGPGGLRRGRLASWTGMGRHDPEFVADTVEAAVEAVEQAVAGRVAVTLYEGEGEGPAICQVRHEGRKADRRLTLLRFEGEQETVARVLVFACHPTFLGHRDNRLSAEWPGEAARRLDGVTLILQGAVGDQRPAGFNAEAIGLEETKLDLSSPEGRMVAAGRAVAAAASNLDHEAESVADNDRLLLMLHSLVVSLPAPTGATAAPPLLRRPAGNVIARSLPGRVRVSLLRAGDKRLVFVPGEVVSTVARDWEKTTGMRVVSLADGYIGYLEAPEALASRTGESGHAYFHEAAIDLLEQAVETLIAASLE